MTRVARDAVVASLEQSKITTSFTKREIERELEKAKQAGKNAVPKKSNENRWIRKN